MFPHTVTIFNIIENSEGIKYHRCVIKDVFHYETQSITNEAHGEKINSIYNVVFSNEALQKYVENIEIDSSPDVFTIKKNDIIVYGEFEEIADLIDIQKSNATYFLIKSIEDNCYGSKELHNILVSG